MCAIFARKSGSSTTIQTVIYHNVSQELSRQYATQLHLAAQVQTCSHTAPGCEAFLSEHGVLGPYDTVGVLCRQKIFFPNPSGTLYCNNFITHKHPTNHQLPVNYTLCHTSTH